MKLKKIIVSIITIIMMIQIFFGVIVNATESQVVVLNDYTSQNNEQKVEENNGLNIYSEAAILMEPKTGKVLYEKNSKERKYPASTTKILTAIIALENCDLDEIAVASHSAIFSVQPGYSIADIQEGEAFTIRELLDVMMIHSANEAANIIAEHISGSISEFANLMNEKAREIGCLDSNFVNANGAHNDNHYSTAYDLALIARYCMENEEFRNIASKMNVSLPTTELYDKPRNFKNTNSLMTKDSRYYYPYCTGIKTGFTTPAKNCLISSSNQYGFELISVVLHAEATEDGSSARYLDTINLFEYGYNNYRIDDILSIYETKEREEEIQNYYNNEDGHKEKEETIVETSAEEVQEIETVKAVKKDYNSPEKDTTMFEILKIIISIGIILFVKKYMWKMPVREEIQIIKENNKDEIYDFRLY